MHETIILFETDAEKKETHKTSLIDNGFNVEIADNVESIFKIVKESKDVCLIIIDYILPGTTQTGPEVCQSIKKDYISRDIPILIIIDENNSGQISRCFNLGASDILHAKTEEETFLWRVYALVKAFRAYKQEVKLAQLKTLHTMLASLSHEFNNTLAITNGNLSLLEEAVNTGKTKEELLKYTSGLNNGLLRIGKVISDFNNLIESDLEFETYTNDSEIFKLKKD